MFRNALEYCSLCNKAQSVASGVSPDIEDGVSPSGLFRADPPGQDARLYGGRDACRYRHKGVTFQAATGWIA